MDLGPELAGFVGSPAWSRTRDHAIIHNHPPVYLGPDPVASFPPSPTDLILAVDRDLAEFVVVSGPYRYSVNRPPDGWQGDAATYAVAFEEAGSELDSELGPVGPTTADAAQRQHDILERLRRDRWIAYERTERY